MSDPVTESAHYVVVKRRGRTEVFLLQQGQIEEQEPARVIVWDRRDRRRKAPEAARPPQREAAAS